jgi:hypothetical protein
MPSGTKFRRHWKSQALRKISLTQLISEDDEEDPVADWGDFGLHLATSSAVSIYACKTNTTAMGQTLPVFRVIHGQAMIKHFSTGGSRLLGYFVFLLTSSVFEFSMMK